MRRVAETAAATAIWLCAGVAAAGEGASDRAIEFVAADPTSTERLGTTATTVLLVATAVGVVVSVILLLLGGARARRSHELLDRLDTSLEGRDD